MAKDFENYSEISAEGNDIAPIEAGDIDASSLKVQEKIRYSQDTKFRKHLTRWVMHIVPFWLLGVFTVVCLCASKVWQLSDIAMSALLTTTTANILGLAYIVLKGMFPQKSEKK